MFSSNTFRCVSVCVCAQSISLLLLLLVVNVSELGKLTFGVLFAFFLYEIHDMKANRMVVFMPALFN